MIIPPNPVPIQTIRLFETDFILKEELFDQEAWNARRCRDLTISVTPDLSPVITLEENDTELRFLSTDISDSLLFPGPEFSRTLTITLSSDLYSEYASPVSFDMIVNFINPCFEACITLKGPGNQIVNVF